MSHTTRLRRRRSTFVLASLVLVGLLSFVAIGVASGAGTNLTVAQQPTQTTTYAAAKHATGIAKTDPSLLGLRGSKLVPVMIKYAFTPTASYAGGVKGLKATSPRVTHKSLRKNAQAFSRYQAFAKARAAGITKGIKRAIPRAKIGQLLTVAYGGIAARVPANKIGKLLSQPGVLAVQKDALNQPLDDNTSVHRRHQRVAIAGRLEPCGLERRRRRDRHRHLAGAPDDVPGRHLCARRRDQGLPVR